MTVSTTDRSRSRGEIAHEWWEEFCDPNISGGATTARLRRSRTIQEALSVPAARILAVRLGAIKQTEKVSDAWIEKVFGVARILAHVRRHVPDSVMRVVGWKKFPNDVQENHTGDDLPFLSEARFQRFLQVDSGDELITAFVRLLSFSDGFANVERVATDFLHWNERTKRRLAFEYYAAGSAVPLTSTSTSSEIDA